jgi:hypothetical protein
MEARELRIGNYLQIDDLKGLAEVCTVSNMINNSISAWYYQEGKNRRLFQCIERFKPIPLTEEWLLKLGFDNDYKPNYIGIDVKTSNCTTDFVLTKPFSMGEWQKTFCYDLVQNRFCAIEFVHELQNLFFALTGQELTLKQN